MGRKIRTDMANRSIYSHGLFGNRVIFNRDRISLDPHTFFPPGTHVKVNYHRQRRWLWHSAPGRRALSGSVSNRTTFLARSRFAFLVSLAIGHICVSFLHPIQWCSHSSRTLTGDVPNTVAPDFHTVGTSARPVCLSSSP